jgi:RNA recognition motif-containing protein
MRGPRSAGYGFVNVGTKENADKAIELLNGKKLEGKNREVIVEHAKDDVTKKRESGERRARRNTRVNGGRRGSKPVPGEVTEAEANGEAEVAEGGEGEKTKKKRKTRKFGVRKFIICASFAYAD